MIGCISLHAVVKIHDVPKLQMHFVVYCCAVEKRMVAVLVHYLATIQLEEIYVLAEELLPINNLLHFVLSSFNETMRG